MTDPLPGVNEPKKGGNTWSAIKNLGEAVQRDAADAVWHFRQLLARKRDEEVHTEPSGLWRLTKVLAFVVVIMALMVTATMLWVLRDIPLNNAISAPDKAILLEAADGSSIGRVGQLRISNAARAEFPNNLVHAVLAIEDRRFYDHVGIDPAAIVRATRRNLVSGGVVEGGSTITQQLVKQRLLSSERSFKRKLREAFAAVWLDLRFTKAEILTRYLNTVYMGAGAQGIPAAAELYFNKPPHDLSLPEAALLAGMIKAPSRINPLRNLAGAQARANVVLQAMVADGSISPAMAEAAMTHPATLNHPVAKSTDTWFSEWVAQEAREVTGSLHGTLRVRTTLVPRFQASAERSVERILANNAERQVSQAALVAMRPNGAVVAMVGGRDKQKSEFNRAVQAQRQPGSAFKLFVYMAALREGVSPADTVDASPVEVSGWNPQNSGGTTYRTVTLEDAFAHSINTAAVRLAMKVGNDKVIQAARDLGINSSLPDMPSLALGTAEVNLLELTAAYAGILAGRAPIHPFGVMSFRTGEQPRPVSIGPPDADQVPLGDVGHELVELLRLPVEEGTARAAAIDGFAAGKTGTTQDNRDAWFIGFTRDLVVGVWVGNDDRSPMDGVTGGELPADIWRTFVMEASEPGSEEALVATNDASTDAQCDQRACAEAYESFNAADCSYQPYGNGPRARCTKGSLQSIVAETGISSSRQRCDQSACARAYRSFREVDCTYQPAEGGSRRACDKAGAATP
jgi:penicillin-binding protein 1A